MLINTEHIHIIIANSASVNGRYFIRVAKSNKPNPVESKPIQSSISAITKYEMTFFFRDRI